MASEVSRAVLEKALRLAEAAHDQAAIADLKGRLGGQGPQKPPTRQVLSKAFYMAAANRDEAAMRDIMGRIQKAGMTLAPMNEAQVSEADKRGAEDTLKDYNFLEKAGLGYGQSFVQTGRGLEQLVGMHPHNQPEADSALEHTAGGLVGNIAGQGAQIAALGGAAGEGLKAAGLAGRALPYVAGALGAGTQAAAATQGTAGERLKVGGENAALSLAGEGLGAGLAKLGSKFAGPALDAATKEAVALADKYHIPLRMAELWETPTGKTISGAVSKLPLSGFKRALTRQRDAFHEAVGKIAGIEGKRFTKTAIKDASNRFTAEYDRLWGKTHAVLGPDQMAAIGQLGKTISESGSMEARLQIRGLTKRIMDDASRNKGVLTGAQLKSILKDDLRKKLSSTDAGVKDAAFTIRSILKSALPKDDLEALDAVDRRYGNFMIVKDALKATKRGRATGYLEPGQLIGFTESKYGATPEMQELAKVGHFIKTPAEGSPTAERYLAYRFMQDAPSGVGRLLGGAEAGAAGAAAYAFPHIAASVLGTGAAMGQVLNSEWGANALRRIADNVMLDKAAKAAGSAVAGTGKALPVVAPAVAQANR